MFIEIIIKFDYQPPLSLPLFLPLFHIHLGKLSFQDEIKYTHSHKKMSIFKIIIILKKIQIVHQSRIFKMLMSLFLSMTLDYFQRF